MSILIKNAKLLLTPTKTIEKGNLYIEDKKIVDFKKHSADTVIDASDHVVMPGLINAHTHIPMVFLRGLAEDLPLKQWLEKEVWPREKKVNGKIVYHAALLGMAEALASGTTSIVDMYFFQKELATAAKESGIRAWLGYGSMDGVPSSELDTEIKNERAAIRAVMDTGSERVMPIISPHSPYTCSKELLIHSGEASKELNLPLQIHVSETKDEVKQLRKVVGKPPLKYLDTLGLIGPRTIIAHGVWLTPGEVMLTSKRGATLAHCPVSNFKLGSGIAPIHKYIEKGMNVALGTDGPASNNSLNMFEEMKVAALGQKLSVPDFASRKVIDMATVNGARPLDGQLGELKPGNKADIIIMNLNGPNMAPVVNKTQIINNLVYGARGSNLSHVIVNGEVVAKDGRALRIDVEKSSRLLLKEMDKRGVL
ncbi:MAG: amidohydrolase [Candidatus Altiarchaeota archaeon]|nr:amidohydrolase [Candidatus Altiarchaeota archaeon]